MRCWYRDLLNLRPWSIDYWYDEQGVPRFVEFGPIWASNYPHCDECALLHIRCSVCHMEFRVCVSRDNMQEVRIEELILSGGVEYGEPPNVFCCEKGVNLPAETIKVLEYWSYQEDGWTRDVTKEITFSHGNVPKASTDSATVKDSEQQMSFVW